MSTKTSQLQLHAPIVVAMTDAYFEVLADVANLALWKGRVRVVDFRGQLTKTIQWQDEIHPSSASFRKLAAQLVAQMS